MKGELRIARRLAAYKLLGRMQPLKLTIALTYMCNSRCRTCDIWRFYIKDPARRFQELSTQGFTSLLEELSGDLVWLEFTGGEPFLREDLAHIVAFALNRTGIVAASITSNGLLTDTVPQAMERVMAICPGDKRVVCGISLDGTPEMHRHIRGVKDGFGQALATFQGLQVLSHRYPNLSPHLCYTVSRWNAGSFEDFYHYMKQVWGVGIGDFSFTVEHPAGYYYEPEDGRHLPEPELLHAMEADLTAIVKARAGNGRRTGLGLLDVRERFYSFYLQQAPDFLRQPQRQVIPCTAARLSAFVDAYGDVYPCTTWQHRLGSLKEARFKEIFASAEAGQARGLIQSQGCPNCWTPCEAQPSYIGNLERILLRGGVASRGGRA